MKLALSENHVLRHTRRRLLSLPTIQAMIVGLIALYSLVGCANLGGVPSAKETATRTTPTRTATAKPTQQGLIWSDEFNGPKGAPPDPQKWTPSVGGEGWGNGQLDYDTKNQNVYQDGQGNLVIEARQEEPEGSHCWYGPCQYTSGQISTKGLFSFTYGRLEARIKLPSGQGIWPAFWLIDNNCTKSWNPRCGEIDIMENIGNEPAKIYGTVHGPLYSTGSYTLQHGAFADNFHIFTLQWDANHLYFFVDGINYKIVDKATITNQADWIYDHPFYIILDIAIGGSWPGNPDSTNVWPQKMYISYVKLYSNN
jgi:beta-glucanase (GH16 family)